MRQSIKNKFIQHNRQLENQITNFKYYFKSIFVKHIIIPIICLR